MPLAEVEVVVIVFIVPKSMLAIALASKPVPAMVIIVPGVPEAG